MDTFALPRARRVVWLAVATMALAASLAWLATETMISILESRFQKAPLSRYGRIDGIIVLGGRSERIIEAITLARRLSASTVVISGAHDQDYVLARAALGPRVMIEPLARNTYQNALFTKRLLSPNPEERWLLVTSATHMPRAIGCFRSVGLFVHAWPVPQMRPTLLYAAKIMMREWLALMSYRLLGRINTLLPPSAEESPKSDPLWRATIRMRRERQSG